MSDSLIGRSGSSTFRPFRHCSVDVARGLALLSSPHRDIAPVRSISPDWYLAQVNPNTAPTDLDLRKRATAHPEASNRTSIQFDQSWSWLPPPRQTCVPASPQR